MSKKQTEINKRGAAAMANATRGRSRTFKDKSKYDRKRDKRGSEAEG